ncbi:AMP-binding protein [Paenibacillus sp. MMS18-CY102]|uniref:AMP-binding protein n=1 Tax=Paenibacillus sp. MMS18-CY102 TaxID=2682849 RepID=UPI00136573AB|nr:AMP-binding protein [Paenibacillus sp. MMS18-CY102]MWC29846.1 AMP-binding protein [Paenibacillus sp. MMS18-CY102]
MFIVDKERYDKGMLAKRYGELAKLSHFAAPETRLYAICCTHPFDVISMVLYLRERGGSVLLLHGETPVEAAMSLAKRAGCSYLIHADWREAIAISGHSFSGPPSLCQFSSGTTGEPKLIARPWCEVEKEIASYNLRLNAETGERPIILVPVSHSFGLVAGVMAAMARGAEPIVVADKNPKFALHVLKSAGPSILYAVPFLLHLIQLLGKQELRLHKLISSGAPMSQALLHRLQACTAQVWQQYGCTETGCIAIGADPSTPYDVGLPLPHLQISLQGARVEEGDAAKEIVVTAGDKTVHTNDLGMLNHEGRIQVLGRMDDLINVSGLKVMPSEVEAVIERLAGVSEVVVCKAQHPVWGESIRALVVASDGVRKEDIRTWCLLHLPPFKVPSAIDIVESIPRLPSGKISRKFIQEQEITP